MSRSDYVPNWACPEVTMYRIARAEMACTEMAMSQKFRRPLNRPVANRHG